jgi:hypothetical protein
VIKPKSYLLLRSFINEADNTNYTGLHQWNFFVRNGKFYIGCDKRNYDVNEEIKSLGKIISVSVENKLFCEMQQPVLWVDIRKHER